MRWLLIFDGGFDPPDHISAVGYTAADDVWWFLNRREAGEHVVTVVAGADGLEFAGRRIRGRKVLRVPSNRRGYFAPAGDRTDVEAVCAFLGLSAKAKTADGLWSELLGAGGEIFDASTEGL
jgi:hypothetical protein